MKNYFIGKLFTINYNIAIHEGNANQRLASQAPQILFQLAINKNIVPSRYQKEFIKFISLVKDTVVGSDGRIPVRINGIQNRTAAKYIKLLIDIQENF